MIEYFFLNNDVLQFSFFKYLLHFNNNAFYLYNYNLLKFIKFIHYYMYFFVNPNFFFLFYTKAYIIYLYKYNEVLYYSERNLIYLFMLFYNRKSAYKFFLNKLHFSWKTNSVISGFINFYNSIIYVYSNNVVNLINKKILKDFFIFLKKSYIVLKKNHIISFVDSLYKLECFKDIYYQIVISNIELFFIFFFIYDNFICNKYINLKIVDSNHLYTELLYRVYSLFQLLDCHYYDDWFNDIKKRNL